MIPQPASTRSPHSPAAKNLRRSPKSRKTSQESYTSVKNYINTLAEKGLEDLDILVAVNEVFTDRELVQTVLDDLRRKGQF